MGWHGYLVLWCAVFGAMALVGYGRSLAEVTRAQRTVRVLGRIERMREPVHEGPQKDGIPVVVSFRDPSTGQEFTLSNDDARGHAVKTAWTGREIGVLYPQGKPEEFRLTDDLREGRHGLGWPTFAVFLVYAGLVAGAAIAWGRPWVLLGIGAPLTAAIGSFLPQDVRRKRRRVDTLASGPAIQGRVVAVVRADFTDDDDGTFINHTPVVAFTTREGTDVLAYCSAGLPDPGGSRGRDLTIHYAAADPAMFTPDLASERRYRRMDIAFNVAALLIAVTTVIVGAVML